MSSPFLHRLPRSRPRLRHLQPTEDQNDRSSRLSRRASRCRRATSHRNRPEECSCVLFQHHSNPGLLPAIGLDLVDPHQRPRRPELTLVNTFTLRLLTAVILFLFIVALCSYDYWMSWADNDATISKLLLWIAAHTPVTSIVFSFWAGILSGHLFMPRIPLTESTNGTTESEETTHPPRYLEE